MNTINLPQNEYFTCRLEENLVVVSKETGYIFILNGTARFVWEDISNGHNADVAASNLSERFGISHDQSGRDVKKILEEWRRHGLLPLNGSHPKTPKEPDAIEKNVHAPTPDKDWVPFCEHVYTVMGVSFRIRFGSQVLENQAHHRLSGHLSESTQADSVIDVLAPGGAMVMLRDGRVVARPADNSELRSHLFGEIISIIYPGRRWLMYLHSAAVGMNGRCVVLPGKGGVGKSTLTAALVHHGLDYFGDDIVPLTNDKLLAVPVPFSICLKQKSWPAVGRYFPQIVAGSDCIHTSGKKARYLNVQRITGKPDPAPAPVIGIVFPQYAPGGGTQLTPLPPTKAFQRIADLENGIPTHRQAVRAIIKWIESTPAYCLNFDSLDKAAEAVKRLLVK